MSVEAVLFARAAVMSLGKSYPISWPNVVFTPPEDGEYLEVIFLENQTETRTQDADGVDHRQGFLQINVVWPSGKGIIDAIAVARSIIENFPKGLNLYDVKIGAKPWQSTPIQEDHKLTVPVSIPWYF